MQTTTTAEWHKLALPFVARTKEAAQLLEFHSQRKPVLILGPEGVGKSALVANLRERQPFVLCSQSETLGGICDHLETELNSPAPHLSLVRRKNRLIKILAESNQTAVFDGVGWATPKVSSFLECVMERVPIWVCARAELARDIGHFWPLLARFEKIELRPFRFAETNMLLAAAIESRQIPPSVKPFTGQLHRLSRGLPLALVELLEQFAARPYDLSRRAGLRLLKLDRRIDNLSANLKRAGKILHAPGHES